jgi:uncharacterized protein (DUF1810 family)
MHAVDDPFNLARFVKAQEHHHDQALRELQAGSKRSHWIWYVLPQLRGLGTSELSKYYGITGLQEAQAYLQHRLLGARLLECVRALNGLHGLNATQILGPVDAMKLQSCLTLFSIAADEPAIFVQALQKYFAGEEDLRTIDLLAAQQRTRSP